MLITADALVAHAVGDYILQTDQMALEKANRSWPALLHAMAYTLPFLLLSQSIPALLFIAGTHFVIDRWRLARYVVWVKNLMAPAQYRHPWQECEATGYHASRPAWLAVWLMIITDNVMHVLLNGIALRWL